MIGAGKHDGAVETLILQPRELLMLERAVLVVVKDADARSKGGWTSLSCLRLGRLEHLAVGE